MDEWEQCIKVLEVDINLIQAHGDYQILVLMGDFNFPNLRWEDKLVRIVQYMSQQEELFANLLGKFYLFNCVEVPTRGENIFDLILTNAEDLIQEVRVEESGSLSDHRWVIGNLDVTLAQTDDESPESLIYKTQIPNFN